MDTGKPASNNMDVPARYLPCLVAGLAYQIASKKPESMSTGAGSQSRCTKEQWNLAADASQRVRRHRCTWRPVERNDLRAVTRKGRTCLSAFVTGLDSVTRCATWSGRFEDGRWNGLLVGRDVVDQDLRSSFSWGTSMRTTHRRLRFPRPDNGSLDESRALSAFDPVGGGNTALGSRTCGP